MRWRPKRLVTIAAAAAGIMVVLHYGRVFDLEDVWDTFFHPSSIDATDSRLLYIPTARRCTLVAHTANVDVQFTGSDSARGITIESFLSGEASDADAFVLEGRRLDSSAVRFDALPTSDWQPSGRGGGRLLVTLPSNTSISMSSARGSVRIEDVRGAKNLNISDGDLAINGGEGILRARCPKGNIALVRYIGPGRIEGGSGSVDLSLVAGALQVVSERAITVRGHMGSIELTSRQGPLDVEMMRIDSTSHIAVSAGVVRLRMPPSLAARLWVRTAQGRLDPGAFVSDSLLSGNESFVAILGGGGPDLGVESPHGFVHLTR